MNGSNYTKLDWKIDNQKKPIDIYFLAVLGLIVFHVIGNVVWIWLNNVPSTWDAALHTIISLRFLEYLRFNLFNFNLIDFLKISEYYPPFVHWIGMGLGFLGKGQYKIIEFSGTLFFALAILAFYLYTDRLFQNKLIAFFSTFFFSFFLTIYQQSRDHMLDIPLTALILVGLYFLEKSERLSNRRNTLIFFLFLSLSFLTKWYAIFYFIIPVISLLFQELKEKKLKTYSVKNMVVGLFIFFILVAPWYLINLPRIIEISRVTTTPELADPQRLLSLENLFFNLKLIIMFQITFFGFIFFLFSLFLVFKKIKYRPVWLTLSILFLNYLIFTLIPNKNIRYTIPITPFIAIIMARGVKDCLFYKNKMLLPAISSFLVFYYLVSYFILSFGIPVFPSFTYSFKLPILGWTDVLYFNHHPVKVIFDKNIWPNKMILSDIFNSANFKNNRKVILVNLVDRGYLNGYNLDPILYPDLPEGVRQIQVFFIPFLGRYKDEVSMKTFLDNEVDFALVPEKYIGLPEATREYNHMLRFQQFFLNQKAFNFKAIKEYKVTGDYFHPELFPYDKLILFKKVF